MGIDLYYSPFSPPSRAAMLAAKAMGVELNMIELDLLKNNDHLKPDFVKLNPMHTIPTINDNGFVLWESRAIIKYFYDVYGKDSSLYPKDPKKLAVMIQRQFFEIDVLYTRFRALWRPVCMEGNKTVPPIVRKNLKEAMQWLDDFIGEGGWVAGDTMTLVDFSVIANLTSFQEGGFDCTPWKNVMAWIERCKKNMPGYEEVNSPGATICGAFFKAKFEEAGLSVNE